MTDISYIVVIISILIFILCIMLIVLNIKYQNILQLLYKIEESEKLLHKSLINKYDLIIRYKNIVDRKLKIESKKFGKVKKINIEKIEDIELDKILNTCNDEIDSIKYDYSKFSNQKSFKGILEDINNTELHLISLRTFYNKNVAEYNNSIKTFPNNVICKLKNLNLKLFFEGKELDDEFKKDVII